MNIITIVKKAEYTYLVSFLAGILAANLIGIEQLEQYGILNEYFIRQLLYTSVNYNELFLYVAEHRGVILLLLLFFGITKLGIPVHFIYIGWNGFSFGVAMVSVIAGLGLKGILILCAFLFPQYLFYIPLYLALFAFCVVGRGRRLSYQNLKIPAPILFLAAGILILGLFTIGIMMESYVNPPIMKKILKNLFSL